MRVAIRLLRSRLPGRLAWGVCRWTGAEGTAGAKAWRWATPECLMPPKEREMGTEWCGRVGLAYEEPYGGTEHC